MRAENYALDCVFVLLLAVFFATGFVVLLGDLDPFFVGDFCETGFTCAVFADFPLVEAGLTRVLFAGFALALLAVLLSAFFALFDGFCSFLLSLCLRQKAAFDSLLWC
jgi:hypothetical protein